MNLHEEEYIFYYDINFVQKKQISCEVNKKANAKGT